MNLFDATSKIKEALSQRDYIATLSHYHLKNGRAYASNGALHASAPIDEQLEHVVPADELDKAFAILGRDADFEWTSEKLVVKKARKRITIRLLPPDTVDLIEPALPTCSLRDDFIPSVKAIRPFISDDASRPWALTAWLRKKEDGLHAFYATNNIVVACATVDDSANPLAAELDVQIPNFALDYLISRGDNPKTICCAENKVSFIYGDGSIMTSQLFAVKMPEQVPALLANENFSVPYFEINDTWRDSFKSLIKLGAEEISLSETLMTAGKRQATMEIEVASPAPKAGTVSLWNPKFLDAVVSSSTHINFANYPEPAQFMGKRLFGVIVGKVA